MRVKKCDKAVKKCDKVALTIFCFKIGVCYICFELLSCSDKWNRIAFPVSGRGRVV